MPRVVRRIAVDFAQSSRDLRRLRTLAACAMLLALGVALDYFGSIYISPTIKISSSFLAIASVGLLFGPVPAMICGGLLDVIMWMIRPAGLFFPGYTLSAVLGGLIYGLCLYNRAGKALFYMAPIAKLLVNLLVNLCLNTYWSMLFTGKAYIALFPARALKNLIAWPIESALLIVIVLFLSRNRARFLR
ncbi:MAG: folate family ECF transporter S component [Christensenellales bacterium]